MREMKSATHICLAVFGHERRRAKLGMETSEKRQIIVLDDQAIPVAGSEPMSATQTFFRRAFETPTGRMRIVSDDTQRLRAIDWDDHEARMQRPSASLLRPSTVTLREASRPSQQRCARRLL